MSIDYAKINEIVQKTGEYLRSEIDQLSQKEVKTKSLNSLVSYVDKTAEQQLVTALEAFLPNSGFIAEEGTSDKVGDRYNWIIDPLDGTTNYIHHLPVYAVSVALQETVNEVSSIVYGAVHLPSLGEFFHAIKEQGAFLNGQAIKVSPTLLMSDALFATGFPYYDYGRMEGYTEVLKELMQKSRGIRRMGAAAADLAYVACGRFEAFYEYSLNPWDVAAGSLLVTEAGGIVTDFGGGTNYIHGEEIIAGNSAVGNALQAMVQRHIGSQL